MAKYSNALAKLTDYCIISSIYSHMQEYKDAKKLIDQSENILIVSHRKPDADTLGAALALKIWLAKTGKNITLACVDEPASVFNFLPCVEEFVGEFDINQFQLVIIVDAGASYMTNFHLKYPDFFKTEVPILNIDHHASNDFFGKINIVDPKAASATVLIYRILKFLNIEIDADIATCLLAGIYSDTGAFMHSNTDKEVYEISADLMKKGAAIMTITKSLFKSKSLATLRLWGKVLEKAQVTNDKVVMSVLEDKDFADMGSGPEQLSGVIDYLNMVPDTKFALLVNEDRNGNVKGSFRTRNNEIDVERIAAVFGGGGHPKASGFMLPGRLEKEVRYTIVSDESKKTLEF